MSSRSHFISSHRNLVPSHPIPRKSGPVRSHLTKILVPSHPIPQRSHPIPVPHRDGTGPGRDILVLAVSLHRKRQKLKFYLNDNEPLDDAHDLYRMLQYVYTGDYSVTRDQAFYDIGFEGMI